MIIAKISLNENTIDHQYLSMNTIGWDYYGILSGQSIATKCYAY